MKILVRDLSNKFTHVKDMRHYEDQADLSREIYWMYRDNVDMSRSNGFVAVLIKRNSFPDRQVFVSAGTLSLKTGYPKLRDASVRRYLFGSYSPFLDSFPVFLIEIHNPKCQCGDYADYLFIGQDRIRLLCKAHSRVALLENKLYQ